ncbi:MAG: FG-GAP repeat domain-containing protein [Candidatus Sumerlaeota bacterium]
MNHIKRFAIVFGVLFLTTGSLALINPDFTPIHLTKEAEAIFGFTAKAPGPNGNIELVDAEVVKGKIPQGFAVKVNSTMIQEKLTEELFDGIEEVPALVFLSTPSNPDARPSGFVNFDGLWYGLEKGDGSTWNVVEPVVDLTAVWNGQTGMLKRCVKYIMSNPEPEVPVRVGARWKSAVNIGSIAGEASDCKVVDLDSDGALELFVSSASGDKSFRYDREKKAFSEITGSMNLISKSLEAAFCDVNHDGRVDLFSWDGAKLSLWVQDEDGDFAKKQSLDLADCRGLAPLEINKQAAVVVSQEAAPPALVVLQADESLGMKTVADGVDTEALGTPRNAVVADFDGDALADIVQVYSYGAHFYKGKADGTFEAPRLTENLYTGEGRAKAFVSDFDMDGRLDVSIGGDDGFFQLRNAGEGRFMSIYRHGEVDYIARQNISDAMVGELNNDGRQDLVIFYEASFPHPFFNRGFTSFGFAIEMDLTEYDFLSSATNGQQAGAMGDLDGDGAQDVAMVLSDGSIHVLFRDPGEYPPLAAGVFLQSSAGYGGPLKVTAWQEQRCLGAWNLTAGDSAFFARQVPGPLEVEWQFPGGEKQREEIIVEEGYMPFYVEPNGITSARDR